MYIINGDEICTIKETYCKYLINEEDNYIQNYFESEIKLYVIIITQT